MSDESDSQSFLTDKFLSRMQKSCDMLKDSIAEGVYFNIVNISKQDLRKIKRKDIDYNENVLFLDMNLTTLHPPLPYLNLLKVIGVSSEDCNADIVGFSTYRRESGAYSVYPIIQGGSYNPYIKYKSNRVSALRRIKSIEFLSRLVNQKVFPMSFVLTFPSTISKLLFDDDEGDVKAKDIHNLFWDKLLEQNILPIGDKSCKTTNGLQIGRYTNLHQWSSKFPFKPHYHFHTIIPNFLYNKKTQQFVRLKPFLTKEQLKKIQILWYECQKEILHYGEKTSVVYTEFDIDPLKVDVFFQYLHGFKADVEFPTKEITLNDDATAIAKHRSDLEEYKKNCIARSRLHHSLKYCTRSYLKDIAEYFDYWDDSVGAMLYSPLHKKQFKKFVEKGCIKNKTSTKGYLRNLKNIIINFDKKRNSDIYTKCYGKKDKETFRCAVTGQECVDKVHNVNVFGDIGDLNIYMAHKSGMIKIGTMTKKEKGEFS